MNDSDYMDSLQERIEALEAWMQKFVALNDCWCADCAFVDEREICDYCEIKALLKDTK